MGYLQSPGIEVKEFDVATIVPGVSTSEAAIGGVFSWGPVEDRELVSTETELATRFGKPTDDNFETFFSAANFLAYSDALWVSRAADANAFNAVANTGPVTSTQIKNAEHFSSIQSGLEANAHFYAKFPGTLGNSLKVAVCASQKAYSHVIAAPDSSYTVEIAFAVNSNVATITVADATANSDVLANTAINAVLDELQIGDYVQASSGSVGSQHLKVTAISSPTILNGEATVELSLDTRFKLSSNVTMNTVNRFWEFFNVVDKAPGTTAYTAQRGGTGDELHIIVVDTQGKFTGQPNTIVERWEGLSRATDAMAEQGGPLFYKDVINDSSVYLYVATAIAGLTTTTAATSSALTIDPYSATFSGGTNSLAESAIPLADLARAYDQFKNPDDVDVSIFITGKSIGGVHGEGLANYISDNIVQVRRDAMQTISPALTDVVNNPYGEAESLIEFRGALRSTSYSTLDSLYKYQYDRYNNKYRWVPGCGDTAGLMARTDRDRDPWYSPAGEERGTIKNIVRLAYNPDQADRDLLYKNDINPVINKKGAGIILYGDKTLHGKPSAFDRINVRRLFITLQKAIKIAANALLFEFNDEYTRARFRNMVQPYLRDVQGRRGITAFKVVCDETNNNGTVVDSNRFIGDIYIKPARSINFITLNFVAVGTDVEFDDALLLQ